MNEFDRVSHTVCLDIQAQQNHSGFLAYVEVPGINGSYRIDAWGNNPQQAKRELRSRLRKMHRFTVHR